MAETTALTYVDGWDLPIANEGGPLSLMELSDGTFALILGSVRHPIYGVIVSQPLAMMMKDELFLAEPHPVEEKSQ